jgi:hypothetical protein
MPFLGEKLLKNNRGYLNDTKEEKMETGGF